MDSLQEVTDAEAVALVRAGRREAFETLVWRHGRMVYAVALARLGHDADAEDVVQETFVQAYLALPSLSDPARFRPWIARIARNQSINYGKKRRRNSDVETRGEVAVADLRDEVEAREREAQVRSRLAALSEDQGEVLTLHYFAGMTAAEIGETLGQSREAVKKRLQRARAAYGMAETDALATAGAGDDDRRRKRIMALVLLLPLPAAEAAVVPPGASTAPGNAAQSGGSAGLALGKGLAVKLLLFAIAAGVLGGFVFWQIRSGDDASVTLPGPSNSVYLQDGAAPAPQAPAPPVTAPAGGKALPSKGVPRVGKGG